MDALVNSPNSCCGHTTLMTPPCLRLMPSSMTLQKHMVRNLHIPFIITNTNYFEDRRSFYTYRYQEIAVEKVSSKHLENYTLWWLSSSVSPSMSSSVSSSAPSWASISVSSSVSYLLIFSLASSVSSSAPSSAPSSAFSSVSSSVCSSAPSSTSGFASSSMSYC